MLTKQKVQFYKALGTKKHILEHQLYLAEGEKLSKEAVVHANKHIVSIICTESWLANNHWLTKNYDGEIIIAHKKQIDQISNLVTPQEVITVCKANFQQTSLGDILRTESYKCFVYCHEMRDPGNAGTILRIADWFGIKHVFTSADSVFHYHPKLVQASMGSIFRVSYQELNFQELLEIKTKIPLIATSLQGTNIYQTQKIQEGIILFGSESHGLPKEILDIVDFNVLIPRADSSNTESLNLAVSCGIVLSHLLGR